MIEANVEIDQAAVSHMTSLLRDVAYYMPERLADETKRAAIYVCKSLRARTKVAPKRIPKSEYAATPSVVPPRYVHSNSAHRKLLRRWTLARKLGTPDAYAKHYFVYTEARRKWVRGRGYVMVGKQNANEIRELLKFHGGIQHRGLAKKSWGWAANKIYNNGAAAGDLSWKHGKKDRRDPRRYVHGMFFKTGSGAEARLDTNMESAYNALQPGGLEEAINAAAARLRHNLEAAFLRAFNRDGGMTAPRSWGGSASSYWLARASEAGVIRFSP
jgi:hypothetical protein